MSELPDFTRDLARKIVRKALKRVSDFPDTADIEQFPFQNFLDYHKDVFINALKLETNDVKSDEQYYDIVLDSNSIGQWSTIKECVDYLLSEKGIRYSPTKKISFT